MNKFIFSVLSSFFLILSACTFENKPDGFTIDGFVAGAEGQTLYLEVFAGTKIEMLDSVVVEKKGAFKLNGTNNEGMFYRLRLNANQFITLYLENGNNVKITTDIETFDKNYTITGSEMSREIRDFIVDMRSDNPKLEELNKMVMDAQDSPAFDSIKVVAQDAYMAIMENRDKTMLANFEKNKDNVLGLYISNYLDPSEHFELLNGALENFKAKNVGKPYWEMLANNLEPYKVFNSLKEGAEAPEIELPNPNGELVKLSSLRGKVVLLDFWASWCGPCRKENPNVVAMYNLYKDKGFEIYGVSLDKDKDKWLGAIKEDKLTWYHVSDLKYWDAAPAAAYGVRSIPATFLLDAEGKIVAKNLRGEELAQKVGSLLNN